MAKWGRHLQPSRRNEGTKAWICCLYSATLSHLVGFGGSIILLCVWPLPSAHPASLQRWKLTLLYNLNLLVDLFRRGSVLAAGLGYPSSSARLGVRWAVWAPGGSHVSVH